jgi:hypothetical protein
MPHHPKDEVIAMSNDQKPGPQYEKPEVKDYGDLRELTRATFEGDTIDVPMFTPFGDGQVLDNFSSTPK